MEKNIFDISDFLPKYPSISDEYLNPYPDEDFNKSIYHKKEFYRTLILMNTKHVHTYNTDVRMYINHNATKQT